MWHQQIMIESVPRLSPGTQGIVKGKEKWNEWQICALFPLPLRLPRQHANDKRRSVIWKSRGINHLNDYSLTFGAFKRI